MKRREIEMIIKRYSYIEKAIKEEETTAVFYIGNRKKTVVIDDNVKKVMEIIDEIYRIEPQEWVRRIIKGIMRGNTDVRLIQDAPYERNGYYTRKQKFFDKVYKCCIAKQLVSYEDIMSEEIA